MNISPRDPDRLVPLTPQAFYALLALAKFQDTGYGLISAIKRDSRGTVDMPAGTVYPLLKRLVRLGYVKIIAEHPGSGPTGISRIYRLTDIGHTVLSWEIDRYAIGAELGRQRLMAGVQ